MAHTRDLLLAAWQNVSRHLEIAESTASLGELLGEHLPLASLAVRRLDPDHRRVPVVSRWPAESRRKVVAEEQFTESDWRRLERWMKQADVWHAGSNGDEGNRIPQSLVPCADSHDCALAPLNGEHGSRGVLCAVAQSGKTI
jgi:hypothetical protein